MHHSRLCALLIDCRTSDVEAAARFWGEALGRPVDLKHPGSRGNYRMLETPQDEAIVQIQRVEHESRVHIGSPAVDQHGAEAGMVHSRRPHANPLNRAQGREPVHWSRASAASYPAR